MLLVTCTDMADLCGNTPETAWAKYGSTAMKSKFCKEVALRTILSSLVRLNVFLCYHPKKVGSNLSSQLLLGVTRGALRSLHRTIGVVVARLLQ